MKNIYTSIKHEIKGIVNKNTIPRYCFFSLNKIQTSNPFIYVNPFYFSKKTGGGKKDDKKVKKEKEKEAIGKEYESVSTDEVKSNYKNKSEAILKTFKETLNEIKIQRSNPKILDNLPVSIKGKRAKLSEVATIMLKAANIMAIAPFDDAHKDAIVKAVESSKLDVQISSEGNNVIVTLGNIPDDMKTEALQQIKKIYNNAKEETKELRYKCVSELKKLEKIIGKEQSRLLEKEFSSIFEK